MKTIYLFLIFVISGISCTALAKDLHLYVDNGSNHVYLGCFTCSPYDQNSIWNEYGEYGSEYSQNSIWNDYGPYGSEYSNTSPWNSYSNQNPVLVDKQGGFYGYFTCNQYRTKRINSKLIDFMCKNRDKIKNNRSDFYSKVFN